MAAGSTTFATNGGRLSLATGVAEHVSAVSAATSIFWVPYISGQIALYSGGAWAVITAAEKSIALSVTQSCTTVSGNTTLTVADSTVLFTGMKVSGSNIQALTTIASITDATHVVLSLSASGNGTNNATFKFPANSALDVFGYLSGSTLALSLTLRSALFTATTLTTQDGVPVKSGDTTKRHLGVVFTNATDGQADYGFTGQYRYSVWNKYNQLYRDGTQTYSSSGTWYKSICTKRLFIDVMAPGGGTYGLDASEIGSPGGTGGTTSFGSHASATGGGGSGSGGPGSNGTGSSGDTNITGGGFSGAAGDVSAANGCPGGRSVKSIIAGTLGSSETVTIGAAGVAGNTGGSITGFAAPCPGLIIARETVEI